nr:tail fiber protein [Pedobacter panaciterrae]
MNRTLSKVLVISLFFVFVFGLDRGHAQNLLDLTGWTIGLGTSGIFTMNGQESENIREWGEGPQGNRVILWKAQPEGASDADGGWVTSYFPIDHKHMYRFTIWIKKTNSIDGTTYFGCRNVSSLAGVPNSNPYFWSGDLPKLNRWYLLVGYIHGSGDSSEVNYGSIYDGVTGDKVLTMTDFKFSTTATATNHRATLFNDPNTSDRQYFYAPRVDLVNGNEPSISELIGLQFAASDQTYFAGKVGIKTSTPGDYDLAVKGKIRAQEIKVELANWPDYVFAKDYDLPSLRETEQHIKKNGHLPGIPSAEEVKANGIDLGEMNAKLLQKIEELTLHLLAIENENQVMSNRILSLEKSKK